jgi:hypothetical protein
MNYAFLLLASFSVSYCSGAESYFDTVQDDYSLKYHLNERIHILELYNISRDEPELGNLLKLSWRRDDPLVFFSSLLDDLTNEKNDYKILFRPLVLFLDRKFKEFDHDFQDEFDINSFASFDRNFATRLAQICTRKKHFHLAFHFLKDAPEDLVECFSEVENRKELMEFFKLNPNLAIEFNKALLKNDNSSLSRWIAKNNNSSLSRWIAECIIYWAPEEFYIDMVATAPKLLTHLNDDLFLSLEISESENLRIFTQMKKLFTDFWLPRIDKSNENLKREYTFYNLLNEFRFGPEEKRKLSLLKFGHNNLPVLAKAALLCNKKDLFLLMCDRYSGILNEVLRMKNLNGTSIQANNFKPIFELIKSRKNDTESESIFYLDFILKFYAISHFKIENDRVIIEFKALKNLLELGFSPIIRANMKNHPRVELFINSVFEHMKAFDEETITSFSTDYVISQMFKRNNFASIELIEFISKSPNLIKFFQNFNIKFLLAASTTENLKRFFSLPNFNGLNQILKLDNPTSDHLITLKSEEEIKVFEGLSGKTVPQFYLDYQKNPKRSKWVMNEIDYSQWRLVLAYWIKSEERDRIKEITSPIIKEMLKFEFPEEMKNL